MRISSFVLLLAVVASTTLSLMVPNHPDMHKAFHEAIKKETDKGLLNIQKREESLKAARKQSRLFAAKEELSAESVIPVPFKSGYIPLDTTDVKTAKDKTFYMYFPSRSNPEKDPLIVWFTGGPGCSSELAIVYENGPFYVEYETDALGNKKPVAKKREMGSWNQNANLLYIDNPIGVGFSTAGNGIVHTENDVTRNFEIFLKRWIELDDYKSLAGRPLFITGESYGGHYVPWISNHIYNMKDPRFNLQGVAIGNGLSQPNQQYTQYTTFSEMPENLQYTLLKKDTITELNKVSDLCANMDKGRNPRIPIGYKSVCEIMTGVIMAPTPAQQKQGYGQKFNTYNIRIPCEVPGLCYDFSAQVEFFNMPEVQKALGVADQGIKWEMCTTSAGNGLRIADWWVDASSQLIDVLEGGIKVLVYSGDLDYICNWRGGELWTRLLPWSGREEFAAEEMVLNDEGSGMSRKYKNFEFLRVFSAGHMVPLDQPKNALIMINKLIGQPIPE